MRPAGAATPGPTGEQRPSNPIARGGLWMLVAQALTAAAALLTTPYVLHSLGQERYGLYLLSLTLAAYVMAFNSGFSGAAFRYLGIYAGSDDRAQATRLISSIALCLGFLMIVLGVPFVVFTRDLLQAFDVPARVLGPATFLVRVVAVSAGLDQFRALFLSQLAVHQRYRAQCVQLAASGLLVSGGLALVAWQGLGLRWVGYVVVIRSTVCLVGAALVARPHLSRKGVGWVGVETFREIGGYAVASQATRLAGIFSDELDTVVVAKGFSVAAVARFGPGAAIAEQLRSIPLNFLGPLTTALTRTMGAEGHSATQTRFVTLQRQWVRGVSGWTAATAGAAYFGVVAWLGPGYRVTGLIAALLAVGGGVNLLTGPLTALLQTVGRPGIETRYVAVSVGLNLVLTVPFILAFGLIGTVVASVLASILGSSYLLRIARGRYDPMIRSFLAEVPLGATALCLLIVLALEAAVSGQLPSGALGLLASGLLALPGIAVFVRLAYTPEEIRSWRSRG